VAIRTQLGFARREDRAREALRSLCRVYIDLCSARRSLDDLRRERPSRPISPKEAADLLRAGADRETTIRRYLASQPYAGPPEDTLLRSIAAARTEASALYATLCAEGIPRDEADCRILAMAPDAAAVRAELELWRRDLGLGPLEP